MNNNNNNNTSPSSSSLIKIMCYFNDKSFTINIPPNESLFNLKNYIVKNLQQYNIYTYETNIGVRYGFPPKLISDPSSDSKTLPELSITNNECLRIELLDPQCVKASLNEIIDYTKYTIKKKTIPADNSCLFNSINFAINNCDTEPAIIRSIISMIIMEHPDEYNEAILDKKPEDYCEWILCGDSWGGGIELSILSKYFQKTIGVVDIKNITIEYFGDYHEIIYLLYDNVHYDVFYSESNKESPGVFMKNNDTIKNEVLEVARELKKHQQYIDTQNFSIRCMQCNFLMKGQNDAMEHSKKTGHINFTQV